MQMNRDSRINMSALEPISEISRVHLRRNLQNPVVRHETSFENNLPLQRNPPPIEAWGSARRRGSEGESEEESKQQQHTPISISSSSLNRYT